MDRHTRPGQGRCAPTGSNAPPGRPGRHHRSPRPGSASGGAPSSRGRRIVAAGRPPPVRGRLCPHRARVWERRGPEGGAHPRQPTAGPARRRRPLTRLPPTQPVPTLGRRAPVVTDLWAAPRIVVSGSDLASFGSSRQPQSLSSPSRSVTTCHAAAPRPIWDETSSCTVEGACEPRSARGGQGQNRTPDTAMFRRAGLHESGEIGRIQTSSTHRSCPGLSRSVTSCHRPSKVGGSLRRADGRQALRSLRPQPHDR
jgi:hypothetical protein